LLIIKHSKSSVASINRYDPIQINSSWVAYIKHYWVFEHDLVFLGASAIVLVTTIHWIWYSYITPIFSKLRASFWSINKFFMECLSSQILMASVVCMPRLISKVIAVLWRTACFFINNTIGICIWYWIETWCFSLSS